MKIKTITTSIVLSMLLAGSAAVAMDQQDALKSVKMAKSLKAQGPILFGLSATQYPYDAELLNSSTLSVVTNYSSEANYQLVSDPIPVTPGNKLTVDYNITVQPGGRISFGWLNTAQNNWYGYETLLFNTSTSVPQNFSSKVSRVVPIGETSTTLVFRNFFLEETGGPGQSVFTINSLHYTGD